jgi:hypothetical protein
MNRLMGCWVAWAVVVVTVAVAVSPAPGGLPGVRAATATNTDRTSGSHREPETDTGRETTGTKGIDMNYATANTAADKRFQNRKSRLTLTMKARLFSAGNGASACRALVEDDEELAAGAILPAEPDVGRGQWLLEYAGRR